MTITVVAPAVLNGASLREELAAVGLDVGWDEMVLEPGGLSFSKLTSTHRAKVESVVAAHTGAPTASDAEDQGARQRIEQVRAKARAILADPVASPDWTAAERKVVLAVLVLRATR